MFVLIAGGGRTAAQLAGMLVQQNHEVHVIESRREVLYRIHQELPTEVIYEGSAIDPHVLEAAGVKRAQVLVALLPSDAENLTLCFYARASYQVPRIIAGVNNPRSAWLFDRKFGVDVALNEVEILASLMEEEMSLGDMMTLLKLRRGRYSLVEEKIPDGAPAVGVAIKDLTLPPNSVIAAIIRHGKIMMPRGETRFEPEDEVLAIVDPEGAEELAGLFGNPKRALRPERA